MIIKQYTSLIINCLFLSQIDLPNSRKIQEEEEIYIDDDESCDPLSVTCVRNQSIIQINENRVRCEVCENCTEKSCGSCKYCLNEPIRSLFSQFCDCRKKCKQPVLSPKITCSFCRQHDRYADVYNKKREILYECEKCLQICHEICFRVGFSV